MSGRSPKLIPVHGGQLQRIADQYGIPSKLLIDFSANINPAGPPASVLAAIQRALAYPSVLTTYPDLELTELKQAIANRIGVDLEYIAVANGFVSLLDAAVRSLRLKRCLLPVPCFAEYRRTLENADTEIVPYGLTSDNHFAYEPKSILETALAKHCDSILLANPQNPSGVVCDKRQMEDLIEGTAQHGINVLLDEAFVDYCPEHSMSSYITNRKNLILFRSVTKFFAIPGLRVAYSISDLSRNQKMNRYIAPWPVTRLASDAVCAALQDQSYEEASRISNEESRSWLVQELSRLGIEIYPSNTNFLLLRFPVKVDVSLLLERMILEQQIVLRSCANFEGLALGHLRTAVRSQPENERLIKGLEQVLPGVKRG